MKTLMKKIVIGLLVCCLTFSVFACGGDETKYYDNENDPIRFSTLEVDKVFNPFFSTSGTDSNVVGMTQLGMLSNDKDGNYTYGDDEAALVKDLQINTVGEAPKDGETDERITTYSFVLKNNVKFSNGSPVTMKDVLFNLYVYLDMAYTGSSTIYSTDIVGLREYRTQESLKTEQDNFMKKYNILANNRITTLTNVCKDLWDELDKAGISELTSDEFKERLQGKESLSDANKHLAEDYEKTCELFGKELETDYSNSLNSYEDTKFTDKEGVIYEHLLTTDVEVFLLNEGYLEWNKKDAKLQSSIDGDVSKLKSWTKEQAIEYIIDDMIPYQIDQILQYWATPTTLHSFIANKELEEDSKHITQKKFPNISGIKFANGGQARGGADAATVNGKSYTTPTYNEDGSVREGYEVLTIDIHGVDPKAIWNFGFAVAPLYYYSGTYDGVDYVNGFNYIDNFGVAWNSQTFMEEVVNSPDKIGLPVGAGPYMAAKDSGGTEGVKATDFYSNSVIYYERNPYYLLGPAKIKKLRLVVVASTQMLNSLYANNVDFAEPNAKPETVQEINGKKDIDCKSIETSGYGYIGVNAGKIPDLRVRQAIMYCIDTSLCIDYYRNEASPIYRSMSMSSWAYPEGCTAYYPYIGGKVPENLSTVDPQYRQYVQLLNKKAGDYLTDAEQERFIKGLMERGVTGTDIEGAKFQKNSAGVYYKGNHTCKYTFTIAGEGTDHPAWIALYNAGKRLDSYGFDITVKNDAQALKKLASGALTVWAAAWGSTIDPDMYQVYHKDSTATSVLNWGYPQIIRNAGGVYDKEVAMLNTLSKYIEAARDTTVQERRKQIYSEALNVVMQLAVELPTYQRNDLFAYNLTKIDTDTFAKDTSSYRGLTSDLHTLSLVTNQAQ